MNTREQLQEVTDRLAQLDPNNRDHLVEIAKLNAQKADLTNQVAQEEAAQVKIMQIQQDHEDRVAKTTDDLFSKIDLLPISNGMRLRDMIPDEDLYQAAVIELKGYFQAEVDGLSKQIRDLQTENTEVAEKLQKSTNELQAVTTQLNQEKLDHTYTAQARDNASTLLEEANKEITQLQEQLKVATAGVKTNNTEDEQRKKQELDARIKLTRTIYNRTADNELFPKIYTAYLASTGEQITFPSYAINSYIVIKDSEVPQFRQDNGIAEAATPGADNTSAEPVTEAVQDSVTPEATFPELPKAELPAVPAPVDQGKSDRESAATEVGPVTVEERFEALERRVAELEKICSVEEAA